MEYEKNTPAVTPEHFSNRDAERSLIGCIINDFRYCDEAFSSLREDDLFYDAHRMIYKAIANAKNEGLDVDLVSVGSELEKLPKSSEEISYATRVAIECFTQMPSAVGVNSYLKIIKELSSRRKAIALTSEIQKLLLDPKEDVNGVLDRLRTKANNITVGRHSWMTMGDVVGNTYMYLEQRAAGKITSITTGIPNVDSVIGGFFPGELTVIGARPGIGKSVFGMNVAIAAAKKGYRVGILSREMTDIQFGQRILSHTTGVDGMRIRKAKLEDSDWNLLAEGLGYAASLPIEFLFSVRTVEDLRVEVQRKVSRNELDILVVDYLQLMYTAQNFKEDRLRVAHISKAIKEITTDFNIPVIALAQVKRYAGGARAKMPTLEDLKDSGSIEQDADNVMFLHPPYDADDEYVDPRDRQNFNSYKENGYTYLCIGVAKQRQGQTGKACVLFKKSTMQYYAIDRTRQ